MSPFRLGANNEPNNLYVGSDAVQRIYHGSEQVWPTGGGGEGEASATITIRQNTAEMIAPAGIVFGIDLGPEFTTPGLSGGSPYDPRHHDIYYFWDFGALDEYTYTAPNQVFTAHKNARYAYGSRAAHVFRTMGTHTVTCTVVEPATGTTATATRQVTISDPNTLFTAPDQTIVVDNTNTGLAAYPGATVVTSVNAAISTIKSFDDVNTPRRIVIRRGQSFTVAGDRFGQYEEWPSTYWLAADEPGSKPVFNMTGSFIWQNRTGAGVPAGGDDLHDWVWQNIDFVGGWDATTETGSLITLFDVWASADGPNGAPRQLLLDGCSMSGFVINIFGTEPLNAVVVNDSVITNWQNYGIIIGTADVVVTTGSAIYQHVNALGGGSKTNPATHNNHSGIRIAGVPDLLIHSTEFYSRNDWFNNGGSPAIWGQQPNVRYDTDGVGGGYIQMQASVTEGGANSIVFGTETSAIPNLTTNIVVEKNYFLATHLSREGPATAKGGMTLRNNILLVPNTPIYPGYGFGVAIKAEWDGLDTDNRDAPVKVYNNTVINLRASEITPTQFAGFTNVISGNDLIYQSNIATPEVADGPLDTTPAFAPREAGYRHNADYGDGLDVLQTAYATPASDVWLGRPQAGSAAIADANGSIAGGTIAYDDFFGNPRPASPSRGALEPS